MAHAGRPGLAAGVVPAAVAAMRDLGARRITARLGPSVCRRCYEVPAQMRADVASVAPEAFAIDRHGRPALDIAAGVLAQLRRAARTWTSCPAAPWRVRRSTPTAATAHRPLRR